MRRQNSKGFTGIETLIAIAIIGAIIGFFGPQTVKSMGTLVNGGDKNQRKQIHKINESYPVMYKIDDKGNYKPAGTYKKNEEFFNLAAQEPPETLWQKFWHLGAIAVIIIVVLSYLGLWPVITLWWNKIVKPKIITAQNNLTALQAQHENLKGEAEIIVDSIDKGLKVWDENASLAKAAGKADLAQALVDNKKAFLDKLFMVQDRSTRQLVDAIQEQLKND